MDMETKICTLCGEKFPATTEYFSPSKLGKYGLRGKCKSCQCKWKKMIKQGLVPQKPRARTGMKYCSRCKNELPSTTEFFHRQSERSDGLREICKECRRNNVDESGEVKLARQRMYVKENRERVRELARIRYYANRDKLLARHKKWLASNAEQVSKQHSFYCKTHREEINIAEKQYRASNPDKFKILRQRRRNREKSVITTLTEQEWQECKVYFNGECAYCGKKDANPTQDHIIALTKDGSYSGSNIIPACYSCNSSKYNHNSYIWYSKKPFFTQKRFKRIIKWIGYDPSKIQQYSMF